MLSICGVPGFSGFFSKDQVIYGALQHGHPWLYALGILTAGITAYYMFRLLFVAFLGEYRGDVDPAELGMSRVQVTGTAANGHDAQHGAPAWIMNAPVAILVVPSVAIGAALLFGGENSPWARFFAPLFGQQLTALSGVAAPAVSEGVTSGIVFAFVVARLRDRVAALRHARRASATPSSACEAKAMRMPAVLTNLFYVDARDRSALRAARTAARRVLRARARSARARRRRARPRLLGAVARRRWCDRFRPGLVRAYALILVFGAACFIVYYAFAGATH